MKKIAIIALIAAAAAPASAQFALQDMSLADFRAAQADVTQPEVPLPLRVDGEKLKIGYVGKAERLDYIRRSSLWVPENELNVAAIDFKTGPYEKMKYAPEEVVTCSYVPMKEAYETGRPNGMSPKFKCRGADGKTFKVKYGETGDVMAEVASSWLLTAIGAYADRMYPVRLNCPDCPSDPFKNEADRGAWRQGQMVAIEDKIGERIEDKPNSGVGFDEFYRIEDKVGAEALAGMEQFLSNSDNKAPNQAIACRKKDVVAGPDGRATCARPVIYLQDMGISFGGRGLYHNSRMNFDKWARERMWDYPRECIMHLNSVWTSSLNGADPIGRDLHQIGEEARQMLVRRLSLLSRSQLIDLFTAARAPLRKPQHTAEEWADLFLRKVDQLRYPRGGKTPSGFACPYQVVPPNSAQIEDPIHG
ncbi:MAG: hypothetical protein M0011_01175 [Elusimicrobia bacterium]|nr:hypothetical protein [Elusimicrobiota bacterium]